MSDELELTVLLPCLNEAETLATCVRQAARSLRELGVRGEVLVADNGSTDGSPQIARANGARVVAAPVRGYGGALMAGIEHARGRWVIMADADDSYDLGQLGLFVAALRAGHDLVMGNRFRGGIAGGAMPPLHRYLGNPVLSAVGRGLFGLRSVGDFHCGIRGFDRQRIRALHLCMPGMEFASEMVVRAELAGYDIAEVPTTLRPAGRTRPPHLRTWRDGWRHLRFLLVLSPGKTLVWPGGILTALGLLGTALLVAGPRALGDVVFDVSALVYACLAVIVGAQLFLLGGLATVYGRVEGLVVERHLVRWARLLRLETCISIGLVLVGLGMAGTGAALERWGAVGFGNLDPRSTLRVVLPAATAIAVGFLLMFTGLVASLLTLRGVSVAQTTDGPGPALPVAAPPDLEQRAVEPVCSQ